jgi:hypothetical protein
MGDQPVAMMPSILKRTEISMPQVGFKLMTPVFNQVKTFRASDRMVTMMRILVTVVLDNYLSLFFSGVSIHF